MTNETYDIYGTNDTNGTFYNVHEPDWRERSVTCLKNNWKVLLTVAVVLSVSTFALMGLLIASLPVSETIVILYYII